MKGSTQLRAEAQRSSAANRVGSATRGSVFGRILSATRASSPSADGSNAPSHARARVSLAVAALTFALVVGMASASAAVAAVGVHSFFGNPPSGGGTTGGLFNGPRGVAASQSGAGGAGAGDVYVVNAENHRIEHLDAQGAFIRAFGQDVSGVNESQAVLVSGASGGTYTLTFEGATTTALAFNASTTAVRNALIALPTIGAGNVNVINLNGRTVFFQGKFVGVNVPQLVADGTNLISAAGQTATVTVTTTQEGGGGGFTGFESCTEAQFCKAGSSSGTTGGALSSPQGIAINQTTGNLYVSNQGRLRIEQFDAQGNFIRAFGQDVVASGPGNSPATSAKQTLTVDATEGQFKLTFRGQTTADLAFNASAAEVDTALEALSTIGAGNVSVTGGPGGAGGGTPYVVTFAGTLANAPMPLIVTSAGTTPLGGGAGAAVANTTTGATGYEICNAGVDTCKSGVSAAGAGAFASTFNGHLAVVPSGAPNAGNVVVADPGNARVNEYTASGAFVRSLGWDVSVSGASTGFETCDAANLDVCKAGSAGAEVGQFGAATPNRVAVDSTGVIYTVEGSPNFRVQKFTPAGPTLTPSAFADGALKGTSTSDTPIEVAIGPSDRVFVAKVFAAGTGAPPAPGEEVRILELNSSGTLLSTSLATGAIRQVTGMGSVPASGRFYLSSAASPGRVYVLSQAAPLTATLDPATSVTATGATFNGKVSPGGVLGDHHFEYVDDAQYQVDGFDSATVLPEQDSGNGTSQLPVSHAVSGLTPKTLYHVRLVVKRRYDSTSAVSGELTFATPGAKPTIAPFGAVDADTTAATLFTRVTPNTAATTYRFEWGPTLAYGASTPEQSAGSGADSVLASAQISGLSPNTAYHFRLVATNASGTSFGPDQVFLTDSPAPGACPNEEFRAGPGALLPECRAYEQVSPVDKNGGDVIYDFNEYETSGGGAGAVGASSVSVDGDAAMFISPVAFADSAYPGGVNPINEYLGRRGAAGWVTEAVMPRPVTPAADASIVVSSRDLGASLLRYAEPIVGHTPTVFGASGPVSHLYLRDNSTGEVTPFVSARDGSATPISFVTGSPDLSRVAFVSGALITTGPGTPGQGTAKVFENDGGQFRLVSQRPAGGPFTVSTVPGATANSPNSPSSNAGSISEDGRHVFFSAPSGTEAQIYRRTEGATTALASPSKRTPADSQGAKQKLFRVATPDGNRVLFTSSEHLTDDANTGPARAGSDLYRYDFETDRLIDISATKGGDGARVDGVVGIDGDAERVYYVGAGVVTDDTGAGGQPPVAGQANLYLWEDDGTADGHTRFIASLLPFVSAFTDPGDGFNWRRWDDGKLSRTTADGRYLLFQSKAAIPGFQTGGVTQVYRYDAEANGGEGELECVSCNPDGEAPLGPASLPGHWSSDQAWELPRTLAEDGTVFFTSQDDLLDRDTNGVEDAYMWRDGQVHLLSTGTSPEKSRFFNASADGSDAFFLTFEALVPQDRDVLADLYTAHVNGGFASQFATPPPGCAGEECREGVAPPPPGPSPTSSTLQGPGDRTQPKPRRCRKGQRRVKARNGKTRCVKRRKPNRANPNRRASR